MPYVMTDMELSDDEKLDAEMPIPMVDKPKYPYGLCLTLTDKELAKLNLDPEEAFVGGIIHGHFLAEITSVSKNQRADGEDCSRVEAQITSMAVESEDAENEEAESAMSGRRPNPLYNRG